MRPKHDEIDDRERIIDILVDILEHCGIWDGQDHDDQNCWIRISELLGNILRNLESLATTDIESDGFVTLVLAIEQDAQNVRSQSRFILHEHLDFTKVLRQCRDLEKIAFRAETYEMLPFSLSLSNCIRNQRLELMDTLMQVDEHLSTIYEVLTVRKSKPNDVMRHLSVTAKALGRRCIDPDRSPWRDAKDLVKSSLSIKSHSTHLQPINNRNADLVAISFESQQPRPTKETSSRMEMDQVDNIVQMVLAFANESATPSRINRSLLLVGPEGSGKSFCLNQIQQQIPGTVKVIRPCLPYDAMGRKVGSTEDLLISMMACAVNCESKSILLLDDIETVCGVNFEESTSSPTGGEATNSNSSSNEPHITARTRRLLLSLLEMVDCSPLHHVMLICTAKNDWGKCIDRFDQIILLGYPSGLDRTNLFRTCMSNLQHRSDNDINIEVSLSNLVERTTGISYAELAYHCRAAMLYATKHNTGQLEFLDAVKRQLHHAMPDSLKTGAVLDFVDIRVMTFRDLCQSQATSTSLSDLSCFDLPLYGKSIEYAWEELQRLIITPLCDADKLHKIMFHDGSSGGKIFAGGVLLTGGPGSGKSMLAYQCATLAALKNPSVKLLDVSCTSLIHKQVGSSEQAIHRLFKVAKAAAPCILLMDGIENVAAVRGNDNTTEGTMDRMLSTLLTELDGVDSQNISTDNPACIAVVGITHNPEWVDPALRRPGRLERVIEVGLPELDARKKIVERELSNILLQGFDESDPLSSLSLAALFIAERTDSFSGAAVVGVCNDAKLRASTNTFVETDIIDVEYAVTRTNIIDAIESQQAGRNIQ